MHQHLMAVFSVLLFISGAPPLPNLQRHSKINHFLPVLLMLSLPSDLNVMRKTQTTK